LLKDALSDLVDFEKGMMLIPLFDGKKGVFSEK
jgi:hypothetical protein